MVMRLSKRPANRCCPKCQSDKVFVSEYPRGQFWCSACGSVWPINVEDKPVTDTQLPKLTDQQYSEMSKGLWG